MIKRALTLAAALACSCPATAVTLAFPYVIVGPAASDGFGFDTLFPITSADGLAGLQKYGSTTASLYLLDRATGQPTKSATLLDVCNPCSVVLDTTVHKATIDVRAEFLARGGFAQPFVLAQAVVTLTGPGVEHVQASEILGNTTYHRRGNDFNNDGVVNVQDVFALINFLYAHGPAPVAYTVEFHRTQLEGTSMPAASAPLVMPSILERSGRTTETGLTNDVQLVFANGSGVAGNPDLGDAAADVWLFVPDGSAMTADSGPVCAPCTVNIAAGHAVSLLIEDAIVAAGGWGVATFKSGFAVVRISGTAASLVSMQGLSFFVVEDPLDGTFEPLVALPTVP
ncbi:MAG TPA: hypothetical protein VKF32_02475 [Thermoanaerobaculia bacterium]|nr:hypothetical protein [Thermoanaerobaculia bacterium]